MRLCRLGVLDKVEVGIYQPDRILLLRGASEFYTRTTGQSLALPWSDELLDFLPPDGPGFSAAQKLADWSVENPGLIPDDCWVKTETARVLVPVPRPGKLLLLAGNYVEHIIERGYMSTERSETFPYVFMKPPGTTLVPDQHPVTIPNNSPAAIDWELELAVVIGRRAKHVKEMDALQYVAGYTVINDISNRKFRPFPERKKRERDAFFDWLHGKWHDGFCPCGPCITSANEIPDPQTLAMKLHLNGELKQNASTAQQVFPVAAVIEFISSIMTLEPGDLISTGTPSGVGSATGTFLKPGDVLTAEIEKIGVLRSPVIAEQA